MDIGKIFQSFRSGSLSVNDNTINIDKVQIKKAGEVVVYNRAWNYISKIDINNEMNEDALKLTSSKDLKKCLSLAIYFFEDLEEYEKCNHIKKIFDKVEIFLTENLEI